MRDEYTRILKISDSAVIDEIAYNFGTKKLRVSFVSTESVWEYEGVWPSDFARLACAYSVGEVFNEVVRNRYDGTRIAPEPVRKVPAQPRDVASRFEF